MTLSEVMLSEVTLSEVTLSEVTLSEVEKFTFPHMKDVIFKSYGQNVLRHACILHSAQVKYYNHCADQILKSLRLTSNVKQIIKFYVCILYIFRSTTQRSYIGKNCDKFQL